MASMRMMPSEVVTAHAEYSFSPDEVEVVEHLGGLGVPLLTRRRPLRRPGGRGSRLCRRRRRSHAQGVEQPEMFRPVGRGLGGREMRSRAASLRDESGTTQGGTTETRHSHTDRALFHGRAQSLKIRSNGRSSPDRSGVDRTSLFSRVNSIGRPNTSP